MTTERWIWTKAKLFEVGDPVRCNCGYAEMGLDKGKIYTVAHVDEWNGFVGLKELNESLGEWDPTRFELWSRPARQDLTKEEIIAGRVLEPDWTEPLIEAEKRAMPPEEDDFIGVGKKSCSSGPANLQNMPKDPNNDMLTEDEDEGTRKEFERIIRGRHPAHSVDVEPPKPPTEMWDGEDLANAIDKTLSSATHPQAMWRHT